jgi:hypothetical protein
MRKSKVPVGCGLYNRIAKLQIVEFDHFKIFKYFYEHQRKHESLLICP